MSEFNLSDKIGEFDSEKVDNNLLWSEDVRKFIKLLKEAIDKLDHEKNGLITTLGMKTKLNKLAGDKLISPQDVKIGTTKMGLPEGVDVCENYDYSRKWHEEFERRKNSDENKTNNLKG